jgi:hypothetical protein
MHRLRKHHKVVLKAPADQDLGRRPPGSGGDRLNSGVREMTAGSQRTVGLGHEIAAAILLDQLPSIAEWVQIDLIDDGRRGCDSQDPLELRDAEVRHPDRARMADASALVPSRPGPGRSPLRPVDEIEIDVVELQPFQARLELANRVPRAWVELRGDEDVARDPARFVETLRRRWTRSRTPGPYRCGGSQARAPSARRPRIHDHPVSARHRERATGSRTHRRGPAQAPNSPNGDVVVISTPHRPKGRSMVSPGVSLESLISWFIDPEESTGFARQRQHRPRSRRLRTGGHGASAHNAKPGSPQRGRLAIDGADRERRVKQSVLSIRSWRTLM